MGYQRGTLVEDTHTDTTYPNSNYIGATFALLGTTRFEYFASIPNFVPRGSTVTAGRLSMFSGYGIPAGTYTLTITPVTSTWRMSMVTAAAGYWRPTLVTGAALTRTFTLAAPSVKAHRWDLDISPILQAMADGAAYNGLRVQMTDGSGSGWQFYTVNSDAKPYIDVTWVDVPEVPVQLSPSAGRYVGTNKPLFRANFNDFGGTTKCAGMQVQVSTSTSFASPEWDSGEQATAAPQLDSAALGYTGAPTDVLRYWRARVQNQAGTWSGWSVPESFKYFPLPVPVMDSPTGTVVEDATPPVLFHAASGTPSLWQVAVYDEQTRRVLWERSWAPMTAPLAVTVGEGVIKDSTTRYRFAVQVRDALPREAIPGFPIYGEAVRVVTYQPSASVTNPTGLTATQPVKGAPRVLLGWSRASAPDTFTVLRNGIVLAVVAAADVFTSGTSYAWVDVAAPPETPLTYTVRAGVNGQSSTGVEATIGPLKVRGVWIVDVADELDPAVIYGEDDGTWRLGEESEWFTPLGADHAVLITAAQRGYEGSMSGELLDRPTPLPNVTSMEMRRRLLEYRARPGRPVYLVAQDTSIRVVLAHVNVTPTPQAGLTYGASFEFRETA